MPQAKSQVFNPKGLTLVELAMAISIFTLPVATLLAVLSRVLHFSLQRGYCVCLK